jgi:hypothetical protein
MERVLIPYLLAGLLVLLCLTVAGYFTLRSRAQARESQRCRDDQTRRERLAENPMAENGGQPLSARADIATYNSLSEPTRSIETAEVVYPRGTRRPGDSAGPQGWR